MNALWGSRCYLAGPIDRVEDCGVGWRRDITPHLKEMGIIVLDPTNKPHIFNGPSLDVDMNPEVSKNLRENNGNNELSRQVKVIRHIDLRQVDVSDFIICSIDVSSHMCGTYEEVFTANRQKKPILFHCLQSKQSMPNWMWGVVPHNFFFDSTNNIINYLQEIDNTGQDPLHSDRWVLIDWRTVYDSHL